MLQEMELYLFFHVEEKAPKIDPESLAQERM